MNEEENRKGPGVFYAVVGVATLVVAIIGATFAYFSASVSPDENSDAITGGTSDIGAGTITLTVNKVNLGGTATSKDLVPAVISTADTTGINAATAKKCEEGGYTGCHVYEITAESEQTISSADLLLTLSTDATTGTNWKYVVYQGTATAATGITTNTAAFPASSVDILSTPGLTAATPVTYYLMVYLENTNSVQNDASTTATDQTGTYTGSVVLQAAGNQVKANLS